MPSVSGDTRDTPRHVQSAEFVPSEAVVAGKATGARAAARSWWVAKGAGRRHFFAAKPSYRGSDRARRDFGLRRPARPRTLELCGFNQGGGLDFVWQRGYGRLRWLDYTGRDKQRSIAVNK